MNDEALEGERGLNLPAEDARVALVRQVLASRTFAKSVRLSQFLEFICRMTLEGRSQEINEQQIGVQVFGRTPAYSPVDDSIVRSQARLLRQRLEEYFEHESPGCPTVLLIPKGGYVPVFERRAATAETGESHRDPAAEPSEGRPAAPNRPTQSATAVDRPRPLPAADAASPDRDAHPKARLLHLGSGRERRLIGLLVALAVVAAVLAIALAPRLRRLSNNESPTLWTSLFAASRPVVIVPSDDGLVLSEEMRRAPVSLDEYLTGSYLHGSVGQSLRDGDALTPGWLSAHQYTSTADLNLAMRLVRLPQAGAAQVETRYARLLRLDDLKNNNVILIGGVCANPWVNLFSPQLNFDVNYDYQAAQGYVLNKHPRPGEQSRYQEGPGDHAGRSYGVLAYLPGIAGNGSALLFEGSGMAGTEAAADFPFSQDEFQRFIDKIGRGPHGQIPYFEVLLETRSLGGNGPEAQVLAWRKLDH